MAEQTGSRVRIEIVGIEGAGSCLMGMTPGSAWEVDSGWLPEGMCGSAYHTLFPYLTALRFGGRLPWEEGAEPTSPAPTPRTRWCSGWR